MSEVMQPQIKADPYLSPMNNYGGSIIVLTNPEDTLHNQELQMRGISINDEGTPVTIGEPLLNIAGVKSIISTGNSAINPVTILGNLDLDIQNLVMSLADDLIIDLMQNKLNYQVKTPINATRDCIVGNITRLAYITMKRAYKEGDRRFWKGSQQEITTRVQQGEAKQSMLSKLGKWGK